MTKLILIIFTFLLFNCKANSQVERETINHNASFDKTSEPQKSSVIFDTLVFNEDMKGEILDEKFKSGKSDFNFYKKFINSNDINKLIILNEEHSKTEIKYLGEIKDLNKKDSYHVITSFKIIGIGEMPSPRGKSEVAFINKSQNKTLVYHLSMLNDLPRFIERNVLFFESEETKIGILISGGLPPMLCVPKIGCN